MRKRLTHYLAVAATLVLVASCGGDSDATPSATPVTPRSIFDSASQRFQQVNSLHFALELAGDVELGEGGLIRLRGADGDLLRPDRARAEADVSFGGANLSVDLISIGQEQFITNFLTGRWEQAPGDLGFNPAVLFDNDRGIAAVLRGVQDPQMLGNDTVSGVKTYHLSGTVSRETVAPITGGAIDAEAVQFEIWIAQDGYDIYKLVLTDPMADGGTSQSTWTLLISKHNSPVTIDRPNV